MKQQNKTQSLMHYTLYISSMITAVCLLCSSSCMESRSTAHETKQNGQDIPAQTAAKPTIVGASTSRNLSIDTTDFQARNQALANGDTTGKWPVKNTPIPLPGALLPKHRIIAYYGNLYSKGMGILGELPPEQMLKRLDEEVDKWNSADSTTKAVPALHYIAVVAQGSAGNDGKYRNRMPDHQIDSVLAIAKMRDALVFLDIQVALSTIKQELPRLEKYLKLPHVHLGIDPEFSMKRGARPGTRIGSFNASDINYCSDYLAKLVQENNLPPKVFVVHRFTRSMVKDYSDIQLRPEVQVVIHMDGWGAPALKKATYRQFIYPEPVEYTGFKIFYKNDVKQAPHRLITPKELLALRPIPIYVQYQ